MHDPKPWEGGDFEDYMGMVVFTKREPWQVMMDQMMCRVLIENNFAREGCY